MKDFVAVGVVDAKTPGADTNTITLFDSTVAVDPGAPPLLSRYRRYLLSLQNTGAGTLKVSASLDRGKTWQPPFVSRAIAASPAQGTNEIAVPIGVHADIKVTWTNGGVLQTLWVLEQGLDDAAAATVTAGDTSGAPSPTTVTTAQLPAALGRQTSAGSTSVVLASDDHLKGQGGALALAAAAEAGNVIPLVRYNLAAPTLTDGQVVPPQADANGNQKTREAYAPLAEDNTNGVIAHSRLPVSAATYAWSVIFSLVLALKLIIKTGPGLLRSISGRIDSTLATGTYYLQLWNAVDAPAGATAVSLSNNLMAPTKVQHVTGTDTKFTLDLTSEGAFATVGITLVISTTEFTYTAGTAVLSATALYK